METLQKKYGLMTATAMVVGIVIGSGVFFKAEKILTATGGNLSVGILAWIIGGVIMIVCAYNFAVMATKYEKVSGIVDYAEATLGTGYGYFVGWFMATIYYPTLVSVLAWVSARYTCVLIGKDRSIVGPECLAITAFYLIASYTLNTLSPILAGKFQVSTTIIKLIPLFAMAIVGTLSGLANGMVVENFATVVVEMDTFSALLTAVCATAFAYEGWIIATSINAELKDAKRNLPKALVRGTFLIMATYILYYVGLSGAVENSILMESGEMGAKTAFANIFSNFMGTGLFVFVVISCLGTLNGLMLACTRGLYALSVRNMGPMPDTFKQIDAKTNMPTNASVLGLFFAGIWLLYFYGANLTAPWFGFFSFDSSELPIITIYAMYIPIFWIFMKRERDMDFFRGKLMPALGILGSLFMIYAAYVSHGKAILAYLIVFLVVQLIGMFYMKRK
jgi:APA family basic amino acid/polyamine antiporter